MQKDRFTKQIFNDLQEEYPEVPSSEIEKVIVSPYRFMRGITKELPLNDMTLEEIGEAKTNFNMPGLFKLYINRKYIKKIRDKINKSKKENE